jgi:hypothetical protein
MVSARTGPDERGSQDNVASVCVRSCAPRPTALAVLGKVVEGTGALAGLSPDGESRGTTTPLFQRPAEYARPTMIADLVTDLAAQSVGNDPCLNT